MSIDLHIHSSFSDGSMTPEELVLLAKKKGLKAISITDHDSVDSVKHALLAGEKHDLQIIPGLELSVVYKEVSLHLLAYLFDYKDDQLIELLSRIQAERKNRNDRIISKLKGCGIDIDKEIKAISSNDKQLGRPHIANILVKKKVVRNVDEAFRKYLIPGGLAYSKKKACSVTDAIDVVHRARGLVVLAHPLNLKLSDNDREKLMDELVACGIDGIEAFYPTHSKKISREFTEYSVKNGLICTGGSDYHGTFKAGTCLAGGKNVSVPENILDSLFAKHNSLYP